MATPAELTLMHTDLDGADLGHLKALMAWWGMLADLSFADLVLFVPVVGRPSSRFVVLGQMRPSTAQTLHDDDLVGRVVAEAERPLVGRAWRLGEIVEGEVQLARGERARMQCIPVRRATKLLAVLVRESALSIRRRPGELEREYVALFERFARMIVEGHFPFASDAGDEEESPRVGDGIIVLDEGARVTYASPNAVNAFHRMGVTANAEGLRLEELGLDETAVSRALASRLPVTEEIERRPDVAVLLRCVPLLAGDRASGALVILRDVTDLRRRDRLLVSKDATIREVHHRVKNNLQTISSLLRLQARRLSSREGRDALEDAERRLRSMATVHEILSRDVGDQVAFDEIVPALVRMAEDAVVGARPVSVSVVGHAGDLAAETATPLAIVITELLANAVEHAFDDGARVGGSELRTDGAGPGVGGTIELALTRADAELAVRVGDDGRGLPLGFSLETSSSLGLSIVAHLVTEQLQGTISMRSSGKAGTTVEIHLPLPEGTAEGTDGAQMLG